MIVGLMRFFVELLMENKEQVRARKGCYKEC